MIRVFQLFSSKFLYNFTVRNSSKCVGSEIEAFYEVFWGDLTRMKMASFLHYIVWLIQSKVLLYKDLVIIFSTNFDERNSEEKMSENREFRRTRRKDSGKCHGIFDFSRKKECGENKKLSTNKVFNFFFLSEYKI